MGTKGHGADLGRVGSRESLENWIVNCWNTLRINCTHHPKVYH